MSLNLPYGIIMKNSLAKHLSYNKIIMDVYNLIIQIPLLDKLRGVDGSGIDRELILLTCLLAENMLCQNTFKVENKQLVIDILDKVFSNLTDSEKLNIGSSIQYLLDNDQVNKTSAYKLFWYELKSYIKRMLGITNPST